MADALRRCARLLAEHHRWHLEQETEDGFGMIPSVEYADSLLCDRTVEALKDAQAAGVDIRWIDGKPYVQDA